jgi:hypothetical protein
MSNQHLFYFIIDLLGASYYTQARSHKKLSSFIDESLFLLATSHSPRLLGQEPSALKGLTAIFRMETGIISPTVLHSVSTTLAEVKHYCTLLKIIGPKSVSSLIFP